jgi:hypothetical protein
VGLLWLIADTHQAVLDTGCGNGRSPEGGPESRLWAADTGRGQGEPHAGERPDMDVRAGPQRTTDGEASRRKRRGTNGPAGRRTATLGLYRENDMLA